MGQDLLAQDYILKQLTASLIYPEDGLGKKFWDRVYQKAQDLYGTTDIPIETFNKVWIMPDKALVYDYGQSALVPPKGVETSSFRFTWAYSNPAYYDQADPDRDKHKYVAVIYAEPGDARSSLLHGYEKARSFEVSDDPFRFRTLVIVYRRI